MRYSIKRNEGGYKRSCYQVKQHKPMPLRNSLLFSRAPKVAEDHRLWMPERMLATVLRIEPTAEILGFQF